MSLKEYTCEFIGTDCPVHERGAIVIVIYNSIKDLGPCLASVKAHAPEDVSVVVVDNGSKERLIDTVVREHPEVHGIRIDPNFGICRANNAGARYALERGAQRIYFLNDDTVVLERFWESCEEAQADEQAQLTGSIALHYNDPLTVQSAGVMIGGSDMQMSTRAIDAPLDETLEPFYPCDAVVGCGWMVAAEVFEAIGFFDESFFLYHEEFEFCLRAKASGYRTGIAGKSRILHKGGGTTGKISPMFIYHHTRNFLWMARLHTSPQEFKRCSWRIVARRIGSLFYRHADFRFSPKRWRALFRGIRDGYRVQPGTFFTPSF